MMHLHSRHWGRLSRPITVFVLALSLLLAAPGAMAAPPYPGSMAALGDSITTAFNSGFFPFTDAKTNSWSTGTSLTVNSHYRRLLALNPAISGKAFNYAVAGAKMVALAGQAAKVGTTVEYVTILMGANDVCTTSEATMTPVAAFGTQFQAAMNTLTASAVASNRRIYVVSIPDVYQLWFLFHNNSTARSRWSSFGICQSLLANPTSTAEADVARRARVRLHNQALNTELQRVCAAFTQCRFDGNKAFNYKFTASDVTTRDYFHPSVTGQTSAARVTWDDTIFP